MTKTPELDFHFGIAKLWFRKAEEKRLEMSKYEESDPRRIPLLIEMNQFLLKAFSYEEKAKELFNDSERVL